MNKNANKNESSYNGTEIAVVGASIRVVKAKNKEEFWNNLKNGVESIFFLSEEELIESGQKLEIIKKPNYVNACSVLEDKEYFDAPFFGYTPREAELLDPQIRLFHECSWEALEDAGIDPEFYHGIIGVYGGAVQNLEWELRATHSGKSQAFGGYAASKLTGIRYFCTRLSYNLNLKGPSINMQTACSTALVAIHVACQALLSGECDAAIAGGVTVSPKKKTGYLYEEGMIYSNDGHTRSFDAQGKGTIFGEGGGAVVLKPLEEALANNDNIYAIIKGTAVNNDGNRKVGFTAPSVEGQVEMMRAVYHLAGFNTEDITYVEAHGTATPLGDSIEFEALRQAFRTEKRNFCRIGSVKSNLGHIDAAAGIAGFIKTILALKYKEIPPSLFFDIPNRELNIIDSPFVVNTELCKWEGNFPLRAAVNSLGMGGTNAHIVLEEAPEREESSASRDYQLLLFSAKSENSLAMMTENLAGFLKKNKDINLADVVYTLQTRRKKFKFRKYLVCRDVDEAIGALSNAKSDTNREYYSENDDKKIIFMFPGQGSQYINMGLDLYRSEEIFRREMDRGFAVIKSSIGFDIKNILYPAADNIEIARQEIENGWITPAIVFIFEYALAGLLTAWGIQPDAIIGHNSGEYAAACLSGVFSLEDALKIIVFKSKLMNELPAGVELNPPQIPFISNTTGTWITGADSVNPAYWTNLLSETIRFDDGIKELLKEEQAIFIEVGPGNVLSGIISQHLEKKPGKSIINLVRNSNQNISDVSFLMDKIGMLWLYGKSIDWLAYYSQELRHCVSLPAYAFEKQKYWIDAISLENLIHENKANKKQKIKDWFHITSWIPEPEFKSNRKKTADEDKLNWLIFLDDAPFGNMLCKELEQCGHQIMTVKTGQTFSEIGKDRYIINPGNNEDYRHLFKRLNDSGVIPRKIVHLWGITGNEENNINNLSIENGKDRGFYSLLFLTQAIELQNNNDKFEIIVVTNQMQKVIYDDSVVSIKSTVLGPVFVIPQEYTNIDCRSIDISVSNKFDGENEQLISRLINDFVGQSPLKITAYRHGRKWKPVYEKIYFENYPGTWTLKERGVYMITGGLGGVGLALAEEFARTCHARLVLTGRTGLPGKEKWDNWLSAHDDQNTISQKIKKIRFLEDMGSEILYIESDVSNRESMLKVKQQAKEKFGTINGIIHTAGGTKGESIGLIRNLDRTKCEYQFKAKIEGVIVLDELFKDEGLDFFILTSSMTSFLGGWEYAAYTAGNFFMDRFVIEYNRWTSIDIDPINLYGDKNPEYSLTIDELYQTFRYILANIEKGQILVCVADMMARIEKASQSLLLSSIKNAKSKNLTPGEKSTVFFPRPNLPTPYVPPTDEIEAGIIEICRDLFGYDKIGIMDNFFDLGGNSLILIRFISEIQRKFEVKVHMHDIFDKTQIRELAQYVREAETEKYLSIEITEKKEYYPLSSAQKRLYVIQLLEDNPTAYNIPWPFELIGIIDKNKLADVFMKVIRRHESLRTSFHQIDGEPVQKIQDNVEFEITYEEAHDAFEVNEKIKRFITPFDLSVAPLMRAILIKLNENDHVLMIDIHHIICDWQSMTIFIQDFSSFYLGKEPPPLKIQYKDYSEWQNYEIQREAIKKQEGYWLNRFKNEPPMLNLPADYPRGALHDFEGERIGFVIDSVLTDKIAKILPGTGTTLFMVLLAAYTTLLFIYTGEEDIVVGVPTAGRNHHELGNILGMFVNMLPMRNNPRSGKTFRQFLEEVKENSILDFENQDFPFESLLSKLNLPRHSNRTPLVDTMFTMLAVEKHKDNENKNEIDMEVKNWVYEKYPAKFELALDVIESERAINMWLTYSVRVFKRATIEKIKIHYLEILEQVIENMDIKLENIVISHALSEAVPVSDNDSGDFDF
ncbi:MAG TPA: SDR family NAD(P)-dependent oxidoreductase [Candidatus Kapabacteria bacterium]|nr:SDR family NAD(P)-dependent oxidoreductase [Candidatus Kapabacteria bacterium]